MGVTYLQDGDEGELHTFAKVGPATTADRDVAMVKYTKALPNPSTPLPQASASERAPSLSEHCLL